jgi:type IV pilus assembly protein PilY1
MTTTLMTRLFTRLLRVALLVSLASPAFAGPSDIDIYSGVSGSDRPNVLIFLDSSANWSATITGASNCYYRENGVVTTNGPTADQGTKLAIEKCALYNLVDALPVASSGGPNNNALFNVAIQLMNEPSNNGAYPRKAFIALTTNNKAALKTLIASFNKNSDKANNADYGLGLYEAYLYYRNRDSLNGRVGSKWDSAAFSGTKYNSPSVNSCGRNYIIVIGNGSPQNSLPEKSVQNLMNAAIDLEYAASTPAVRSALKSQISNASLGNDAANWSDEMARFMRGVDVSGKLDVQGIITHAIAVKKGPSDGDFPALMNSIASHGGGSYYEATSADALLKSLLEIFNQIQAVNSVFASASLPVSVNARGTYLNQVYMGMFRPDPDGKPRWRGNLKQYRFGLDNLNNLFLVDSEGNAAVSAANGFISPSAVSFWTQDSNFWMNQRMGTPESASDRPDGEIVEKGGIAQGLRTAFATSQSSRKVYTCLACSSGTVLGDALPTRFETGNTALTQAMLGASNATERSQIIDWVRGTDNAGDEVGPTTTPVTTVRPSIHGDVLHSRPAVINFGGSTGVVVFYGSNDGQLRAVNGNQNGSGAGQELWSFVPQEVMPSLKRLRSNTPDIELSTTPAGLGAAPRDYFVDGPIGVYQKLTSSGSTEQAIIYVGMRRGGRQLYALDVTNPTAPKFLWKLTPSSPGMGALGQTWSEPKAIRVKGRSQPVLIFGGGYDASVEDGAGGTVTMGNAVYVVDAFDGSLVKAFTSLSGGAAAGSIGRSVTADISVVDTDFDGKIDRAYAVDLGGQVYRIDFESEAGNDPPQWSIYKLADLGGGTSTGRKFFFAPDVIVSKNFTALLFGSGDREKPLLTATQDHFFQIFDRRMVKGAPSSVSPTTWSDLSAMGTSSSTAGAGCYMALEQGEKVVNAAASIAGSSFFGTNRPTPPSASSTTCSANLGIAKSYAMPLFCVASAGSVLAGGGLPPSPVAGVVTVDRGDGSSVQVPFVIGAPNPKNSCIEGARVRLNVDAPRKRRYWYHESRR